MSEKDAKMLAKIRELRDTEANLLLEISELKGLILIRECKANECSRERATLTRQLLEDKPNCALSFGPKVEYAFRNSTATSAIP